MDKLTTKGTNTRVILVESNGETSFTSVNLGKEEILELLRNHISGSAASSGSNIGMTSIIPHGEYVFIYKGFGYKKVAVRDICYIEAARNYCDIHLNNGVCMTLTMPMVEVCEYLSPIIFKRVHRSFVVNLGHVDTYIGNCLTLTKGEEIPIGREYRESVKSEFVCIGSRKRVRDKKI